MKITRFNAFTMCLSAVRPTFLYVLLLSGSVLALDASAADAVSATSTQHSVTIKVGMDDQSRASPQSSSESHDEDADHDSDDADHDDQHNGNKYHDDADHHDMVQVFGDSSLGAGQRANNLVSVLGSSTSDGDVSQNVVSVLGNTRVTGTVGQNAVAVFGNNYINNKVGQNVVAVLGDIELGPQADIGQNVVAVGGTLKRDPAAIIHGEVTAIRLGWLKAWIHSCLFHARLLAFDADVMWAWWIALIALLAYALTALLFARGVDRCVAVMEEHPGHVVLTSLLTIVGIPMLMFLIAITIIGIPVLPLVGLALMIAGFFGKVVILAWIGRRFVKKSESGIFSQPVVAVLVGGMLIMLLYTVPVLSFILYKVLGLLGLGVAVYALLIEIKSRRERKNGNHPGPNGGFSTADLADKGDVAGATEAPQADLSSSSAASPVVLNELVRAGFWIRMVALMIDAFLIGIVTSMVIHPKWFGVDSDHVMVTLLAVYGAVMWKLRGATVGDIVFKLQVVRADGRELDWPTAIVRSLGCFLSIMVIGLGFFWIAFDENKQGWHDKIAGTLVVHNPKGLSLV